LSKPANADLTSLSRLANESGGRFTEKTNDLTLGYARAHRDLGCVYSVGFYLEGPDTDQPRDISVRVLRPGLRAIHPTRYVFRSEGAKQESLLKAAWASPEMFQTGVMRAHVFPLRPTSKGAWEGMLVVSFPIPLPGEPQETVRREFGAMLRRGSRVAHRLDRTVTIRPGSERAGDAPLITFMERVELEPGSYDLTAVLASPGGDRPEASRVEIEIPEVPRRELLLAGPILGRAAGPNLVLVGGQEPSSDSLGDENSFQPLLVQQIDEPVDLVSLVEACIVSRKRRRGAEGIAVDRSLRAADGASIGEIDSLKLDLEGDDVVRCQHIVDLLPVSALGDGEYEFEANLGDREHGTVRFAVGVGGEGYNGQSGGSIFSRDPTSE